MTVYIDILFVTNFIMDFLLVGITAELMSAKVRLWRRIAAAAAGGAAGVCFFIPDLSFAGNAVTSVISGGIIVLIAFMPCGISELLKRLAVMYLGSAVFAGAAVLDMTMFGGGIVKNGIFYVRTPRIILAAAVVFILTRLFASKLKRRASQKISGVTLEYMGRKVSLPALTDTGNGLSDPSSHKPVMLIELSVLRRLVGDDCCLNNLSEWVESERLRTIPYHTVDGSGYLTGVVLDRVYIDGRCIEDAVAAVCAGSLKYPVILHAGM